MNFYIIWVRWIFIKATLIQDYTFNVIGQMIQHEYVGNVFSALLLVWQKLGFNFFLTNWNHFSLVDEYVIFYWNFSFIFIKLTPVDSRNLFFLITIHIDLKPTYLRNCFWGMLFTYLLHNYFFRNYVFVFLILID